MSTIGIVLLVAFIVVCVLLVLLVLVQDDGQSGMGGLLGGRGTAAFGSHSANVLTKATTVLVVLFFVLAIALAMTNKKPKVEKDLEAGATVEAAIENSSAEAAENAANPETTEADTWWNKTSDAE